MNDTQSTAAVAVVSPVPETDNSLAVLPDIGSPEAFKARIEREQQMRNILRDYVKQNLKEGHHFYTELGTTKLEKPALKGDGAHNICSLFKLIFGVPQQQETYFPDGHYQVRTTIDIFNVNGDRISTGIGICTTRESKYRWRKESRTCPDCGMAAIFKDNQSAEGGWYCWKKRDGCGAKFKAGDARIVDQQIGRVENTDLADSYNTVAKMSLKRAKVGAVCQVPLVSELFVPGEDDEDEGTAGTPARHEPKGRTASARRSDEPADKSVRGPASATAKAVELARKLIEQGVEEEDLVRQFLPEGVATFDQLNDLQAAAVVPGLAELLNAKVNGK